MSLSKRKYFYNRVEVNGNIEHDYLTSKLPEMNLDTNRTFVVGRATVNRPDLISFLMYGSYNYGWLIAYHNDMLDPIREFSLGKKVNIPSLDSYYRFYNRNARRV